MYVEPEVKILAALAVAAGASVESSSEEEEWVFEPPCA